MTSEAIIKILKDKQATKPCPACGQDAFTLLDGDFRQEFIVLQKSPFGIVAPSRRSLNYIILVCDNCGYLRQHAKKPLGIPTRKI